MNPGRFAIALALATTVASCTDKKPYNLDGGDEVTVGALYVEVEKCASCHQTAGAKTLLAGDTTATAGSTAYGENLTGDVNTGLGSWADEQIVRALRFGLDTTDQELCSAMPRFPNMSDLEANAIVAYLRSLPVVSNPNVPESVCPPVKPRPVDDLAPATVADLSVTVSPHDLSADGGI